MKVTAIIEMGALVTMTGKIAHAIQKWMRIVFPNQSIQQNVKHKFKIGDKVIYVNDFGVCWGVKEVIELDERSGKPTYHYKDSDTPWFSVNEENFTLAKREDLKASPEELQQKYGFTPTEWYGCY